MANSKLLILYAIYALALFKCEAKHVVNEKSESNCLSENAACVIENNGGGTNMLAEFNQTNRVGCFERCSMNPHCQHWTWWGDSDLCQLFSICQHSPDICKYCQTGPRSCGMEPKNLAAVSGGLSARSEVPNQNKIYMVDEHNICSQPSVLSNLATMPRSRWGHVSSFIESKFIVCGGTTDLNGYKAPNNTCDVFCLSRNEWLDMDSMSENRHGAAGGSLLGKMYVLGGHNGVAVTDTVEVYDPFKQAWSRAADMMVALSGHCIVTFQDTIIVLGGTMYNGKETANVYSYNVTTNMWGQLKPMLHARSRHGCSLNTRPSSHSNPITEIVVTGGTSMGQVLSSTESFDLSSHDSTAFADLPFNMVNHVQLDLGSPRIYGGDISGVGRNLIVQYANTTWDLAPLSLPTDLLSHHATKYPANFVKC